MHSKVSILERISRTAARSCVLQRCFWFRIVILISVFYVSASAQCTCEASTREGYTCMKELADFYTLHWAVDDDSISMALVATGAEWVGISFAEEEDNMEPADVVIGWVEDGEATVTPYRIDAKAVTNGDVDDSVTITSFTVSQTNSDTTVEFTRPIEGGGVEIDVEAEDTLINFAVGDEDDLVYHGPEGRGQTTICLAAEPEKEGGNEETPDDPEEEEEEEEDEPETPEDDDEALTGCTCLPSDNDEYTCMKQLADYYTLHWRYEDDSISMALVATGAEWVGISFAEEEDNMEPADVVIGWVEDGEATVTPYRIDAKAVTNGDVDDSVTITSFTVSQTNSDTTVEFTRPIEGGGVEIDVEAEDTLINFAVGDEDDLVYHGPERRGQTTICIAAKPTEGGDSDDNVDLPADAPIAEPPIAVEVPFAESPDAEDISDLIEGVDDL